MVFDISLVFWSNLVPWVNSIAYMELWDASWHDATQSLCLQVEIAGRQFLPGENKSGPRLLRSSFGEVSPVD